MVTFARECGSVDFTGMMNTAVEVQRTDALTSTDRRPRKMKQKKQRSRAQSFQHNLISTSNVTRVVRRSVGDSDATQVSTASFNYFFFRVFPPSVNGSHFGKLLNNGLKKLPFLILQSFFFGDCLFTHNLCVFFLSLSLMGNQRDEELRQRLGRVRSEWIL